MTTSTPLMSWVWADSMSWLMMVICSEDRSRVMRSAMTLTSMPRVRSQAAAAKSCSVVEAKVNDPVSS